MNQGEFKEKEEQQKLVEADSSEAAANKSSLDTDSFVGQTIGGHYQILSEIGSGGMSTVYKAKHQLLEKMVAIKLIQQKYVHDKATIIRFQQEAKAAAALKHNNICGVTEFEILDDGRAFIVMDYVEGKSLADILEADGNLSEERALSVMAQVADGLEYAHSQGVIHRDVKPANIVILQNEDGSDTAKIVDFGIAKLVRDDESGPNLTQTGDVFGTPNYMSPEQCHGSKIDEKTDMYSFGCVLHEIVTGEPPFKGSSSLDIIMKHVNDEPPKMVLAKEYANLNPLVQKCLAKAKEERYLSMKELRDDLKSIENKELPANIHSNLSFWQKLNKHVPKIIVGVVLTAVSLAILMGFMGSFSKAKYEKQWRVEHAIAEKALESKKLEAAEISLEKSLEIAKKARNQSMVTLTLKELHDVEEQLGKVEEAKRHNAKIAVGLGSLKNFFFMVAGGMITVGVIIFLFFLFIFGPRGKFSVWDEKKTPVSSSSFGRTKKK